MGLDRLPQLPSPDVVAFDLDGTLTTLRYIGRILSRHAEVPAVSGMELAHHVYAETKQRKNKICPSVHLSDDFKRSILSLISPRRFYARRMLRDIKDMGTGVFIVSNNAGRGWGELLLRHYGLDVFLDNVAFKEAGSPKPKPDALLSLSQVFKEKNKITRPITLWFVGDMPSDMQMAVAANDISKGDNVIPIAMCADSYAADWLKREYQGRPHAIVNTCDELRNMVHTARQNHQRITDATYG